MSTAVSTVAGAGSAWAASHQSTTQHTENTKAARITNEIGINSDILMTLLQADSDITSMRSEAERDSYGNLYTYYEHLM